MKSFKRVVLIAVLVLVCVFFFVCDVMALPDGAEPVGICYGDPTLKMFVVLDHPEWTYYKDRELGQVYFFNANDPSGVNCISISAYAFAGDAGKEAERLWEIMRENYSAFDVAYKGREEISVKGGYSGYLYKYDMAVGADILLCNCLFWSTEEMMYTCTVSADAEHAEEVRNVLDGILESFISM